MSYDAQQSELNRIKFYSNGTFVEQGNQSGSGGSIKTESPEKRLSFGSISTSRSSNQGFAVIDNVMIWEEILTDTDVALLYWHIIN